MITNRPLVPSLIIDAKAINAHNIPLNVPKAAGYSTGTPDVRWTPDLWAYFIASGEIRIDQAPGLGLPFGSDIKDVETDAATIDDWIEWAWKRIDAPPPAGPLFSPCYISEDRLAQARAAAARAALPPHLIGYGVANWNLDEAQAAAGLGGDIVWRQWASPSSNPDTLVPGTNLTLAEAQVDLGVAVPWWHPPARPEWEQRIRHWSAELAGDLGNSARSARELVQLIDAHLP